jgi:hypothetical protein
VLYATSCNLHGVSLSNRDKRRRAMTLLEDPEWSQWSDNHIARHCGLSQAFVSAQRRSLKTVLSENGASAPTTRTYTNKYGQTRTMDVGQIGRKVSETPRSVTSTITKELPTNGQLPAPAVEPVTARQRRTEEEHARRFRQDVTDVLDTLETMARDYGRETVMREVIDVYRLCRKFCSGGSRRGSCPSLWRD